MGSVWSRIGRSSVVGHCCNCVEGRCNSVDERPGWERELLEPGSGSCSCGKVQLDVGLGRNGHHLGIPGCSISRHKIHRRIGSRCRIDRRSCVAIGSVDIAAEQAAGSAVVALAVRRASDRRWLGI